MSSKKYKNIYVNGCSYTAGHEIQEGLIWPELLSKKMNLNLINQAVNGNSMSSIMYNSVSHLQKLNSDDTLVVIGLTWETRTMLQFDKFITNITNSDLFSRNSQVKLSTWRRVSSPYTFDENEINLFSKNLNTSNYDKLYNSFVDFYQILVENDKNLSNNQNLILETQILLLQSFLNQNDFNYRFVNWNTLIDSSKFKNVISFDNSWKEKFVDEKTNHPSEEGCVNISEVIYDNFNK
jgi:hypothetical protein